MSWLRFLRSVKIQKFFPGVHCDTIEERDNPGDLFLPKAVVLKKILVRLAAGLLFPTQTAEGAVLWMDQAQRLQEISATFLDSLPVSQPIAAWTSLGVRADLSLLPSPNPKVGAKNEKLPSAPVQSIPLLTATTGVDLGASEGLACQAWGGVLPPGGEKLFGIKASLFQSQFGGRCQFSSTRFAPVRLGLGGGVLRTNSSLKGTISSQTASDTFTATNISRFVELNVQHLRSGLFAGLTLGNKKTTSRLAIVDDATDLTLTDTLSNAGQPYWSQYTIGVVTNSGWGVALSELVVPSRLEMPRISVSWTFLNLSGARHE